VTLFPELEHQLADAAGRITEPSPAKRSGTPRRRRRRALAVGIAAAVLAGVVLVASLSTTAGVAPALAVAQKTYVAVSPGRSIIHFVFDTEYRRNGKRGAHLRTERWQLGRAVRTRTTAFAKGRAMVAESDTDGKTLRFYDLQTRELFVNRIDAPSAKPPADPFATFRDRYRAGQVKDIGPATIDGRPVRKLQIKARTRTITYLVGANDGAPLAIKVFQVPRQYTLLPNGKRTPTTRGTGTVSRLTRVLAYEKLPSTRLGRRVLRAPIPTNAKRATVRTDTRPPAPSAP